MKISILATLLLLSSFAFAKGGPCEKDRNTLCAAVEPGKGAMMKCMKENEAKLSAECKAFRDERKSQMQEIKEACHEDAETHCSGMKRKDLKKCMLDKKDSLSEECKSELKELKGMRKKHKGA